MIVCFLISVTCLSGCGRAARAPRRRRATPILGALSTRTSHHVEFPSVYCSPPCATPQLTGRRPLSPSRARDERTGRRRAHFSLSPASTRRLAAPETSLLCSPRRKGEASRTASFHFSISPLPTRPGSSGRELASGKRRSLRRPPFQASCPSSSRSYPRYNLYSLVSTSL